MKPLYCYFALISLLSFFCCTGMIYDTFKLFPLTRHWQTIKKCGSLLPYMCKKHPFQTCFSFATAAGTLVFCTKQTDDRSAPMLISLVVVNGFSSLFLLTGITNHFQQIYDSDKRKNTQMLHNILASDMDEQPKIRLIEHIGTHANLNAYETRGTSLLTCCLLRKHFNAAELLLQLGADIEAHNNDGETPLITMAKHSTALAALFWLLTNKANVHAITTEKKSALHKAATHGNAGAIHVLCENGAFVDAQNAAGKTPLHSAFEWLHFYQDNDAVFDDYIKTIQTLLMHNASSAITDNTGKKPIDYAPPITPLARYANTWLLEWLISHGADCRATNDQKETALHIAAQHGNVRALPLLYEQGIPLDAQNASGQTALHKAVIFTEAQPDKKKGIPVIRCLLQELPEGPDDTRRDCLNKTAAEYAVSSEIQAFFSLQKII